MTLVLGSNHICHAKKTWSFMEKESSVRFCGSKEHDSGHGLTIAEPNVNTSISSLERLKSSLDFSGASQGLETIDSTAGRMDFSILNNAVSSVIGGFNSLEVIAITALSNITNSAVNAGKRILSSLTIEPIKTGFNEYELKMDSIQIFKNCRNNFRRRRKY